MAALRAASSDGSDSDDSDVISSSGDTDVCGKAGVVAGGIETPLAVYILFTMYFYLSMKCIQCQPVLSSMPIDGRASRAIG